MSRIISVSITNYSFSPVSGSCTADIGGGASLHHPFTEEEAEEILAVAMKIVMKKKEAMAFAVSSMKPDNLLEAPKSDEIPF